MNIKILIIKPLSSSHSISFSYYIFFHYKISKFFKFRLTSSKLILINFDGIGLNLEFYILMIFIIIFN